MPRSGARWAARRDRLGVGSGIITLLLAVAAGYALVREIHFGVNALSGTAHVEDFTSSRGRGDARVIHEVEGKQVRAALRTWFCSLEKGGDVPVLYLPEEPARVELDSIWQRYLPPGLLLLLFGGVVVWELVSLLSGRRKQCEGKTENPVRTEAGTE